MYCCAIFFYIATITSFFPFFRAFHEEAKLFSAFVLKRSDCAGSIEKRIKEMIDMRHQSSTLGVDLNLPKVNNITEAVNSILPEMSLSGMDPKVLSKRLSEAKEKDPEGYQQFSNFLVSVTSLKPPGPNMQDFLKNPHSLMSTLKRGMSMRGRGPMKEKFAKKEKSLPHKETVCDSSSSPSTSSAQEVDSSEEEGITKIKQILANDPGYLRCHFGNEIKALAVQSKGEDLIPYVSRLIYRNLASTPLDGLSEYTAFLAKYTVDTVQSFWEEHLEGRSISLRWKDKAVDLDEDQYLTLSVCQNLLMASPTLSSNFQITEFTTDEIPDPQRGNFLELCDELEIADLNELHTICQSGYNYLEKAFGAPWVETMLLKPPYVTSEHLNMSVDSPSLSPSHESSLSCDMPRPVSTSTSLQSNMSVQSCPMSPSHVSSSTADLPESSLPSLESNMEVQSSRMSPSSLSSPTHEDTLDRSCSSPSFLDNFEAQSSRMATSHNSSSSSDDLMLNLSSSASSAGSTDVPNSPETNLDNPMRPPSPSLVEASKNVFFFNQ